MITPYRFTVHGETPGKKNNVKFSRWGAYKTKHYRLWHAAALKEILMQWDIDSEPIENKVAITLRFYHGDNVRRDSDNGTSSIFDLLQDAGILSDDRWQIVRSFEVLNELVSKDEARCEIEIMEIE